MEINIYLTKEEIENLKHELPLINKELNEKPVAKRSFFRNPFRFLSNRFNITLLKYIGKYKLLINSLNDSVKEVFDIAIEVFNNCFACKLAVLLLIIGILAKFSIPLIGILEFADQIMAKLEEFFEDTSDAANKILEYMKDAVEPIRPSTLALKYCQFMGLCRPFEPLKIEVSTGTPVPV